MFYGWYTWARNNPEIDFRVLLPWLDRELWNVTSIPEQMRGNTFYSWHLPFGDGTSEPSNAKIYVIAIPKEALTVNDSPNPLLEGVPQTEVNGTTTNWPANFPQIFVKDGGNWQMSTTIVRKLSRKIAILIWTVLYGRVFLSGGV